MQVPFPSALIRYERLRRNWSQGGLCEGICAVSYLSKIEQGKAEPSEEILSALIERLDIAWHGGVRRRRPASCWTIWRKRAFRWIWHGGRSCWNN